MNVFDANTAFRRSALSVRLALHEGLQGARRKHVDANFDIYNPLNSDAATAETTGYSGVNGGAWRKPTGVIQGRLFKFGMRWDF